MARARVDVRFGAQAPFAPRVGPLAEPRQHEEIEHAPVSAEGEVQERLAQLGLEVDVLHEVRLVDDVDEMVGLGDSPEHAPEPGAKLEVVEHPLVHQLPHVEVRAPVVGGVEPQEGREHQALPVVVERVVELGLDREREAMVPLGKVLGCVQEDARLDLHAAAHLQGAKRRRDREQRSRGENRPGAPGHKNRPVAGAHHRVRLSALRSKSRSVSPVSNR